MSYDTCLELAGAEVLAYETFGSYQGDWLAKVKHNGNVKWIRGSFGSCTGCDAIEAALSDVDYDDDEGRAEKMREIGESELSAPSNYAQLIKEFKDNAQWDGNALECVAFLEKWGPA